MQRTHLLQNREYTNSQHWQNKKRTEIIMASNSKGKQNTLQGLDRNIWVLTATSFFNDISSDMILNLIPLFLTGVLGQTTAVVGLIEGIAETTSSMMKVFSGGLSDRLGKRKWLAALGYGLSAVSKPFLYIARSWGVVLGVRFSDRFGKGIRTAPKEALLSQSAPKEKRGLAFGIHRAGDSAGAFLGILIATLVIWRTQDQPGTLSAETFRRVVLFSMIPAFLAVLVLIFGAREVDVARSSEGDKLPVFAFRGMDRRFLRFLWIMVLFTLGNSSDAFIILLGQERGLTILAVMGMLLTFNAVYTVLSGPAGALSDRIGRRKLIIFGWLAYGLIYLGFALTRTGTGIWVFFGLYGVYYAAIEGVSKAYIADLVPAEKRATAYGLFSAAVGLTAFPASLIAGVLWQGVGMWAGFGPSAPFLFGGGLALIAVALFGFWLPKAESG
jgi:MFS family permease